MLDLHPSQIIAIRRHSLPLVRALGISDLSEYDARGRSWAELCADEREAMKSARKNADRLAKDEDEGAGIEAAHNAHMALLDLIHAEKNERTAAGDKNPSLERRAAMIPNPGAGVKAAAVAGAYAGPETPPAEAFALRSGESFEQRTWATARDAEAYRGLGLGGFLRATVLGAKTDVEKRALAEGSDSTGGFTVPDVLSARLIDRLRTSSVVSQLGAQFIPLTSDRNTIAKIASDPVPAWRAENAAVVESDPSFAAVTLIPRSLAVLVRVSRELLEDSLNVETAVPQVMATALALELDRVCLLGTGVAPQPRGVANFASLTPSRFPGGGLNNYTDLIRARTALMAVNSRLTGFAMHPEVEGRYAEMLNGDGQYLQPPEVIRDVPRLTSTAIPTDLGDDDDETMIFAADWSRLLVGIRSQIRIEVSREIFMENLQVAFLAHMRADVAAEHEAAFAVLSGVKVAG